MKTVLTFIAAFAAVMSAIVGIVLYVDKRDCEHYSEATGRPTKFVNGECYTKYKNEWFARSEIKVIAEIR